jgi:hypothetical protein
MSTYASFTCEQCHVRLSLGKAIMTSDDAVLYYHIGGPNEPRNPERPDLTCALWKMLADHAEHRMRIAFDTDEDFDDIAEFTVVGGDTIDDISFDEYLDGWPGQPCPVVTLAPDAFIFPGLPDRDPADVAAARWSAEAPGVMALVRAWAQPGDEADDTRTRVYAALVDTDEDADQAREDLSDVVAPMIPEPVVIEVAVLDGDELPRTQQRLFDAGVILWEIEGAEHG